MAVRIASAVALLFLSSSVIAQRTAETVQVTIVEVPVTVADRGGNAVRNLTKDDFQLFDDGRRMPIEYFEVLDMNIVAATPPGTPLPPAATRNFLLLFDLANSSPGTIGRAMEAATTFLDTQLAGRDLAAVCIFTAESGAKMLTGFSNDRDFLKAAVRTLGHPRYFRAADPLMISMASTESVKRAFDGRNPGWAGSEKAGDANMGKDSERELMAELIDALLDPTNQNRATAMSDAAEQRNRLRIQLTNMASIARVLDRLRGRKQIILLSEGFDARMVTGKEDLSFKNTQKDNDLMLSGDIWKVDHDQRLGNVGSSRDISDMAEIFRRSDVVLHAIDIKGLRSSIGNVTTNDVPITAERTNDALFLLTRPTGGTVFEKTNDLAVNFERMLKRQEVVYLLGFRAKSTGEPGRFHSLRVKTTAPAAQASHRAGYYEPSPYLTNIERSVSMGELLMSDTTVNELSISLGMLPMRGSDSEARIPIVVEMRAGPFFRGIEILPSASADLFVYAFDEKNRVRDFTTQRIALDLTQADEKSRGAGLRFYGTLQLPPGKYSIRAALRVEESGRIGFVRREIEVPPFDGPTVTGPVLFADAGAWPMLTGSSRGYGDYPFAVGGVQYVPRNRPELSNGVQYRLGLYLSDVQVDGLGLSPAITNAAGSTLVANVTLAGRTASDDRGDTKLLLNFRPEGLQAGSYELRLTVRPKDGPEALVSMPFVLR